MRQSQETARNLISAMTARLPTPDHAALTASLSLSRKIADEIAAGGGWMPFSRFMELALYAPGLGYYSGGAQKFGAAGDFITAPELTPLFAQSLATQAAAVMADSAAQIIEIGAGSGILAAELLLALEAVAALPERYRILELSGELRQRQAQTLAERAPHLAARVEWLETLPQRVSGLVLANEVLDAMPVALVSWTGSAILERGVINAADAGFAWEDRPAPPTLLSHAEALGVHGPYLSEIGLATAAWVAEWGRIMERGALLLIDYGYPQREYYHPQRNRGTLLCHYRHRHHENPLWLPGLNDITAHVDFTAVANAAHDAGLEVIGYTSQAQFLLNCGITAQLAKLLDQGDRLYLAASRAVGKLISPEEMGEQFKVIALGRGLSVPLAGFLQGDRCHAL